MAVVDISGLDKADVLAALWNNSQVFGMGILQEQYGPGGGELPMDREWAQQQIDLGHSPDYTVSRVSKGGSMYFDYLHGRLLKVNLSQNVVDTGSYDRDLGEGRGEKVIERLRATGLISRMG